MAGGRRVVVRLPRSSGGGRRRVALLALPLVLAVLGVGLALFTVSVGPDEFAVRQVYIGPKKGIQEEVYGPGFHFVVPGYERLHRFPRTLQVLEFNDDPASVAADAAVQPSIRIQTSEGYQVTVDVTIAYRITDPYKLLTQVGPGRLYESALMVPRSDKVLRQKLGELNAEDFYQGSLRRARAEEARELLQQEVGDAGIEVWAVMVRHYTYDDRYQAAIEQRKIQDQTVFKNRAEAEAAAQEAEKNRVLAEGQAAVEVERERGRAEVKKIRAEADLYYRQRVAEGDLLVALAEAEGTKLQNRAMRAAGSEHLVGLEMAKVLQGAQVIVVPTDGEAAVNPLDLDSLVRGW